MNRKFIISVLLVSSLVPAGCSTTSDEDLLPRRDKTQSETGQKSLTGVAELAHTFGALVPFNDTNFIRLAKLHIASAEGFGARQLVVNVWPNGVQPIDVTDDTREFKSADDMRSFCVGDKGTDTDIIILGRIDTRRDSFENFSYVTSPRGELRTIVYTPLGRYEERIVTPGDPVYQKASKDFELQVMFWIGIESDLKANLESNRPRR